MRETVKAAKTRLARICYQVGGLGEEVSIYIKCDLSYVSHEGRYVRTNGTYGRAELARQHPAYRNGRDEL